MDPNNRYFILADGMGGHNGGEIASYTAVTTANGLLKDFHAESLSHVRLKLEEVLRIANDAVFQKSLDDDSLAGMGTTLVISYLYEGRIIVGHCGDSRAYLFQNGVLTRLTKDHSLVQEMVDRGDLSIEDARIHPKRHIITKAIGTNAIIEPDVSIRDLFMESPAVLLMCTDGLTDFVSDDEISDICRQSKTFEDSVKSMMALALERGGLDNITIVAVITD